MRIASPEKFKLVTSYPYTEATMQSELGGHADVFELFGAAGETLTITVVLLDGTSVTFTDRPEGYRGLYKFKEITTSDATIGVLVGRASWESQKKH